MLIHYNYNFWGIVAVITSLVAFIPYIFSILKGKTKPSAPSWLTWTFLTFVVVISSRAAGASWQVLLLPIWLCFSQFLVTVLAIKWGDNNWDKININCIALAIIGVGLWWFTGNPLLALFSVIVADSFASIPNFRHVWINPEQENLTGWTLGWLSSVFELFTVHEWSLAESGWAVYFFLNMSITLFLVIRLIIFKKLKHASEVSEI